jgi:ribosome biogenesis GTPase
MRGTIIKSTGSWYMVQDENGGLLQCRIKGKLKLKGMESTNPVAVGDTIQYEMEPGTENGVISNVEDRKNYIIRKSNNLSRQTQIIAANLDLAVMVATLVTPSTSMGFIDRFMVTAEAYHIPVLLLLNKSDLYQEDLKQYAGEVKAAYASIGYRVLEVSAKTGANMDLLVAELKGKTSLLAGHSGVGKSSILNYLEPGVNRKTAAISDYSSKGVHTTTFAEMFELKGGGRIIDTPGIKDFGVVDMKKEEVSHYFPEMRKLINDCRFNNCLHVNEPGCAVLKAVEEGSIHPSRYRSYVSIMNNEDIRH